MRSGWFWKSGVSVGPGHTQLTLSLSGRAGKTYDLDLWGLSQVRSVTGGKVLRDARGETGALTVTFMPDLSESYVHRDVVLNFAGAK
jgi:hypothetical protein